MATKPVRKYKYGNQPIRITTVEIVEKNFGGKATAKEVDAVLKELFPHYKDDTRLNLIVNSVNCNRGHWSFNRTGRRTDDTSHRHNQYDRLYKRGDVFEIYQPSIHGVFEIYQSLDGKWLTREPKSEFEKEVEEALKLTHETRRKILSTANTTPQRIEITSSVFKRNANVVAQALSLANGKCQSCNQDAPFQREDGTPYLEVHHVEWLSLGGEDSVNNAIALCPNCHRQAHHGKLKLTKVNADR